ncbi:MAG: glycosyltransferase [Desulfurococcus sp.]|nr:glycosyltransferase [Desulfurococcus sp.]
MVGIIFLCKDAGGYRGSMMSQWITLETGSLVSQLAVIYGLILLLAGRFIVKIAVSLGLGLIGGYIAYLSAIHAGLGYTGSLAVFIVVSILVTLVGWFLFRITISLLASLSIWPILANLPFMHRLEVLSILVFILLFLFFYVVSDILVTSITVIAGLALIYVGLSRLSSPLLALLFIVLLVSLRIYLYISFKW